MQKRIQIKSTQAVGRGSINLLLSDPALDNGHILITGRIPYGIMPMDPWQSGKGNHYN